ncbi:MAG: hypothetical protein LBK58_05545, partial [Prevotellaceae bacterium]|nr:hypothetical protein [Prevotellaceae bacterium]
MKYTLFIIWLFFMAACSSSSKITVDRDEIPDWGLGPFVRDTLAPLLGSDTASVFYCPVTGKVIPWEDKSLLCASAAVKDGKVFIHYRCE